jgi:hypothetical protein
MAERIAQLARAIEAAVKAAPPAMRAVIEVGCKERKGSPKYALYK